MGAPGNRLVAGPTVVAGENAENVRIVIFDHRTFGPEEVHDGISGGFAVVGHAGFVGNAEHKDPRSAQSAASGIHGLEQVVDHVIGHRAVDLSGQLDKAGVRSIFTHFPREVIRIDRDAVSAHAGTRVESHEAVGLGLGRIDHFPDIDAHQIVNPLEFVDQGDVDEAKDVFGQFDGLGGVAVLDWNEFVDRVAVEFESALETGGGESADDFRNMAQHAVGIARILAFRGEGEVKIHAGLETRAFFEHGPQFLAGCSRVGAGFERDEHAAPQMGRHLLAGRKNMGKVGVMVAAQRGRHADDHSCAF